jgi:hypothetical protein
MAKKGVKRASPKAAVKKNAAPGVATLQPKTYSETVSTADLPDHIYTQLKICLSKITGFSIDNIFTTDSLANKFHFNPCGQRVLAQNLESCFAQAGFPIPKKLDRDAMQNATDVGSVATIINTAFGV